MQTKRFVRVISWVCLLALLISAPRPSAAEVQQNWKPELAPPDGGVRLSDGAIRIILPPDLDVKIMEWLALELDDIDVTQIVVLEGNQVVLTPPQPLSYGEHRLRLVQYDPDRNILERGVWTLDIRQSANFRKASFESNASLNATYRAADGDIDKAALPAHLQGTGSAQLQGTFAKGNWEVTGTVPLIYNSLPELPTVDSEEVDATNTALNKFEVADFLFTGKAGPLFLNIGHHAVGPESLVMQQFNRRGLSVSAKSKQNMVIGTTFAMRTEPIIGFRQGLGIADSDKRVTGAIVTARPLQAAPDKLALTATYLHGEGADQSGEGVVGDGLFTEGDAWSVAAESLLLNNRLRLRGEYAGTRFDFDGPNTGSGKENDDAVALLVDYSPWTDKKVKNRPMNWQLGMEYKNIGTFFHSLANPGLPADKELMRGFTSLDWAGLNLQASLGREEDNVNDINILPRTRKDLITVQGTYSPPPKVEDKAGKKRNWLGTPTYSMGMQTVRDKTVFLPDGYEGGNIDLRTRDIQIMANFAYDSWYWSISRSVGWQDDFTDVSPDTRNDLTGLDVNLNIGERLSIGAQLQLSEIKDRDNNIDTTAWLTGITTTAILVPEKLTGTLSYQLNREKASDDSINRKSHIVDFNLSWQVRQPKNNRPGITVWLQGQYQDVKDEVEWSTANNPYQVFLGATITWPYSYPAAY